MAQQPGRFDFDNMSDEELLTLAKQFGVFTPEESTADKILGTTEKVSGGLGLGGLGLAGAGFLLGGPIGAGLGTAGALAGTLSSAGTLGAGIGRLGQGKIGQGALETGMGALGMGVLSPFIRGVSAARAAKTAQSTVGKAAPVLGPVDILSDVEKSIHGATPPAAADIKEVLERVRLGPARGKTLWWDEPTSPVATAAAPSAPDAISPIAQSVERRVGDQAIQYGGRRATDAFATPEGGWQYPVPNSPTPWLPGHTLANAPTKVVENVGQAVGSQVPKAAKFVAAPPEGSVQEGVYKAALDFKRLQTGLGALVNMTGGEDLAKLTNKQFDQALDYLQRTVQLSRSIAKSGKVTNRAQLEAAVQKAISEAGQISTDLATRIALASIGAGVGAAQGDTPTERLGFGAIGAAAGASAPSMVSKLATNAPQAIEDVTFFSLLSNPLTLLKANLGAVGGAISKATEMITYGTAMQDANTIKNGASILKSLMTESPKIYAKALVDPRVVDQIMGVVPGHVPTRSLGGIGRLLSAGDAAAIHAMTRGGISVEEAARYTLSGNPTSKAGQGLVQWLRNPHFSRNIGRGLSINEPNPLLKVAMTQMAPFPRTGVQMIERGALERTPAGLVQLLPGKLSMGLGPMMRQGLGNTNTPAGMIIAQALMGTGAGVAGAAGEEKIPTALQPLIGAALGPYAVPYGLGWGANRAMRSGKPAYSGVSEALGEVVPVSRDPAAIFTRPLQESASRVIPGFVAQIAQAMDPAYSRQTGPAELMEQGYGPLSSLLGAYAARIPGIRENLPEEHRPVDAFGRPRISPRPMSDLMSQLILGRQAEPSTSGPPEQLQKLFSSGPSSGLPLPPAMPIAGPYHFGGDPRLTQLKETGVNIGPPSGDLSLLGQNIPVSRDERLLIQGVRGLTNEKAVELISRSPVIAAMPPGEDKKKAIEMVLEMIRELASDVPVEALIQSRQNPAK